MMEGQEIAPMVQPERDVNKIIEFRLSQTSSSRVCEYITGLKPDDPDLGERLVEDQKIIRTKYNLPDRNMRFDYPREYENYLREAAKIMGIELKSKSDCGSFFQEHPRAGGAAFDSEKIGIDIKKDSLKEYQESLLDLEHEYIHAFQYKFYPGMLTEVAEYDAYVAGIKVDRLKNNPQFVERDLFEDRILVSVLSYYEEISMKTGEKVKPVWNNVEYFLKYVDNVSEEEIEKYVTEIREMQAEEVVSFG